MATWPVVRTRSSHLVLFAVPSFLFFSGLSGLCNPVPAVFPGYSSSTLADGWCISRWTTTFCFSLQVVFQYSRLRALRSMCAAGWRSHTFTRCLHFQLFTLARVLSCSLEVMVLMRFFARSGCSRYFPIPVSTGILTGVPDGSSVVARPGYRTSHPTSARCPSADGTRCLDDSCEDTDEEEDHCIAGQITDRTAIANTPGLRAEGRWPWHRSLVAFLAGRESGLDGRLVRVAFVLSALCLLSFFPGCF